jgi:hypothetical protein
VFQMEHMCYGGREVHIKELKKISNSVSHIGYPSILVNRLKRFYCPRISRIGKCSKPCSQSEFCRTHIRNIINDVHKWANSPIAVFVWRIREEVASIEEERETPQVGSVSSFGESRYASFQEALNIIQNEI